MKLIHIFISSLQFLYYHSACCTKSLNYDTATIANHNYSSNSIDDNFDLLKMCSKGKIINTWDELFIYREKCKHIDKLMNERETLILA